MNEQPNIIPAGEKVVNRFGQASAVYYIETKRFVLVGESFTDARKALSGLEIKVSKIINVKQNNGSKTDN
jgi:hypothetical protein